MLLIAHSSLMKGHANKSPWTGNCSGKRHVDGLPDGISLYCLLGKWSKYIGVGRIFGWDTANESTLFRKLIKQKNKRGCMMLCLNGWTVESCLIYPWVSHSSYSLLIDSFINSLKNVWVYLERAHPAFLTTLVVLVFDGVPMSLIGFCAIRPKIIISRSHSKFQPMNAELIQCQDF